MKPNIPTVFVIFGATGDLVEKKLFPALFNLYFKNKLPPLFRIIGFSRRDFLQEQFKSFVHNILKKRTNFNNEKASSFLNLISYHKGDFTKIREYKSLAETLGVIDKDWRVCSNKLFYLAVPPAFYKTIFLHLAESGLTIPCGPDEGWTRVLVEKPIGHDLKTAEELDFLLSKLFKEEQIYRIDHYLAKEMLQNILNFRFSNNLFEGSWNNRNIEKIHIRLHEKIGVEGRGSFYDGLGALRDVGQNHLLQMLALVTMERPDSLSAEEVRKKRAKILEKIIIPDQEFIKKNTYRAQYKGYREIKGVLPNSTTETYFNLKMYLSDPRFLGIPVILESGKRMGKQVKDITIAFKHTSPCLCPNGKHLQNKIVISLEPAEAITIFFWSRKPGFEGRLAERTFNFLYRRKKDRVQYIEEHEKLLLDAILGNQLLFLNTEEVKHMWRFIDPIVKAFQKNLVPLDFYMPDSSEAVRASSFIDNPSIPEFKREVGIVGLGKMGGNIARRLNKLGWRVVAFNRTFEDTKRFIKEGGEGAADLRELVEKLKPPRIVLLSLPAGDATNNTIEKIINLMDKGDFLIDAGNSFYKDTITNTKKAKDRGIRFIDVGISGGPEGALNGACLMVGGEKRDFEALILLFVDMVQSEGVEFFEGYGAGHFVKMVHNGIEYGIMQAIAEGFTILKNASFKINLLGAARVYNHGSVIESRLINWLYEALEIYGSDLKDVSGTVGHTGEGEWTVRTAGELGIKAKVIEEALKFRINSENNPSYTGKILSALRARFGGHPAKNKK